MIHADIFFFIFALFAEIIGTMAEFGSSTIFLPIALLFFDFRTSLILVAISHASGNVGRISFFRYGLDKALLIRFGLPSVIFTIIGAMLIRFISQSVLILILGVFLGIYGLLFLHKPDLSVRPSLKNSIIGGILSGFFAGLIGTGGALRGAFLTSFKLEKSIYVSTMAAISLAVDITRIPIYLASEYLPATHYHFVPLLFLTAMIGSYLGKRIVYRVPQEQFRTFVLLFIIFISLKLIHDGLGSLL